MRTCLDTGGLKTLNYTRVLMMSAPRLTVQRTKGGAPDFSWNLVRTALPIHDFCHESWMVYYESLVFADL